MKQRTVIYLLTSALCLLTSAYSEVYVSTNLIGSLSPSARPQTHTIGKAARYSVFARNTGGAIDLSDYTVQWQVRDTIDGEPIGNIATQIRDATNGHVIAYADWTGQPPGLYRARMVLFLNETNAAGLIADDWLTIVAPAMAGGGDVDLTVNLPPATNVNLIVTGDHITEINNSTSITYNSSITVTGAAFGVNAAAPLPLRSDGTTNVIVVSSNVIYFIDLTNDISYIAFADEINAGLSAEIIIDILGTNTLIIDGVTNFPPWGVSFSTSQTERVIFTKPFGESVFYCRFGKVFNSMPTNSFSYWIKEGGTNVLVTTDGTYTYKQYFSTNAIPQAGIPILDISTLADFHSKTVIIPLRSDGSTNVISYGGGRHFFLDMTNAANFVALDASFDATVSESLILELRGTNALTLWAAAGEILTWATNAPTFYADMTVAVLMAKAYGETNWNWRLHP